MLRGVKWFDGFMNPKAFVGDMYKAFVAMLHAVLFPWEAELLGWILFFAISWIVIVGGL